MNCIYCICCNVTYYVTWQQIHPREVNARFHIVVHERLSIHIMPLNYPFQSSAWVQPIADVVSIPFSVITISRCCISKTFFSMRYKCKISSSVWGYNVQQIRYCIQSAVLNGFYITSRERCLCICVSRSINNLFNEPLLLYTEVSQLFELVYCAHFFLSVLPSQLSPFNIADLYPQCPVQQCWWYWFPS